MLGLFASLRMPVQAIPSVDDKKVEVTLLWPLQPAHNVERYITSPVEQRLSGLSSVKTVDSYTISGMASITATIRFGVDPYAALNQITSAVHSMSSLPMDMEKPTIEFTGQGKLLMTIVAEEYIDKTSDAGQEPDSENREWSNITRRVKSGGLDDSEWIKAEQRLRKSLIPNILSTMGVQSAVIVGERHPQVKVLLRRDDLSEYNLNPSDVFLQIRDSVSALPSSSLSIGKRSFDIYLENQTESLQKIQSIVVDHYDNDVVFLRDVADIRFGSNDKRSKYYVNSREGLVISVRVSEFADVADVAALTQRHIDEFNNAIQEAGNLKMRVRPFYDSTEFLQLAFDDLQRNLLFACLSAIFVIFLLWRGAVYRSLCIILSIPFSFLGTLLLMHTFGQHMNLLVIAGLSFSSGMVVDNAIVIMESIRRRLEKGQGLENAKRDGIRRTSSAIISGTLTTLVALTPILFISEGTGLLIRDIIIPVMLTIALSLVYSLWLAPNLISQELSEKAIVATPGLRRLCNILKTLILSHQLKRRIVALASVFSLALLVWSLDEIDLNFLPQVEEGYIEGWLFPHPSLANDPRDKMRFQIERILEDYCKQVGLDLDSLDFLFRSSSNAPSSFWLKASNSDFDSLVSIINEKSTSVPDAFLTSQEKMVLPKEKSKSLILHILGSDVEEMSKVARYLWQMIPSVIPGAISSYPWIGVESPQLRIELDQRALENYGIDKSSLAIDIAANAGSVLVKNISIDQSMYEIMLASQQRHVDVNELGDMVIHTASNGAIRASELFRVKPDYDAGYISHRNGTRAISLDISLPDGISWDAAREIINRDLVRPYDGKGDLSGKIWLAFDQNLGDFDNLVRQIGIQFLFSVIGVYLILVIFVGHWIRPILILSSIIFAISGGLCGVYLADLIVGLQPDIMACIGFVVLTGIVVNNNILIVEDTHTDLHRFNLLSDAIVEAVKSRYRAILMSSSTTILALVPLLLFPAEGSEMYMGIAFIIIAGFIAALCSTLLIVPMLMAQFPSIMR